MTSMQRLNFLNQMNRGWEDAVFSTDDQSVAPRDMLIIFWTWLAGGEL